MATKQRKHNASGERSSVIAMEVSEIKEKNITIVGTMT